MTPESTAARTSAHRFFLDIGPLRRFPQYRRLWIGYAIRQLGAQLTVVTVIYQVYRLTHSNLDVGLISLAQLGPGLISPVFGGAIADAVDRRKLLLITAVGLALCTTGLAVNSLGSHPQLWPLYVLSAAAWGLTGIDTPTRTAIQMTLVDRESYVAANVLRLLLQQTSTFVGPAIAGLLIAVFSKNLDIVYWIDVASTLAALQALIRLPALRPQDGGRKFGFSSIAEGFSFLKGRQVIQACFITDFTANVLGLPVSLFPYMATVHFHGGSKTFGLLTAAPGAGAMLGSILSGWTHRVKRQGRAVLYCVVLWGVVLALFGVTPWLGLGLLCLVTAGWANTISATFRNTIIQVETPDRLRGRLTSIASAVGASGPRLGNTEAGVVAAFSSAQVSIISGGIGCVIALGVIAELLPRFATYELPASNLPGDEAHRPVSVASIEQPDESEEAQPEPS